MLSEVVAKKELNIVQSVVICELAGTADWIEKKSWDAPTEYFSPVSLLVIIEAYLSFNYVAIHLEVLSQQSDGNVLLKQQEALLRSGATPADF